MIQIQAETLELLEWHRLCKHLATFTATKLGAFAARQLAIPETKEETDRLLAQTTEAYQLQLKLVQGLSLDGIQDIGASLERADRQGILFGEELLAIATTLAGARQLRRVIDDQEDVPVLTRLVQELRTYPELEQEIHRCIDERGEVTDRASAKMGAIRARLQSTRDRIYQILQGILQRKTQAVQQQIITQREGRFVIPVKAPQKDAIPGIVHDASTTGATVYVEPHPIVALNNELRQIQRAEQTEAEAIRRSLTEQVAAVVPDLERLLAIVTTIDLALAKARYSYWLKANPPRLIDPGDTSETINLRQLRHPLLIWQQEYEQGPEVVPIDITINPQIRVVAITGPNTGGKTVTLKTIGLAALMAKVGLFIPAQEPVEIPWFEQVLADIGDEQSIEQSLSTFSGHIRRITRILQAIGEPVRVREGTQSDRICQSLVLLDEIGAGTDPTEGTALAIALLQTFADRARLTVATTHFGELKALKYKDARFENASVEFDDASLQPTYRLLWGIPGRSNALKIAERLGLEHDIVELAGSYVGAGGEDVNQVIAGLEAQRRQQETKAIAASQLLQETERLHGELAERAIYLQEREKQLKQALEKEIKETLLQAKGEIAKVIRRLQQGKPTAAEAQKATAALDAIAENYLPSRQPTPALLPNFMPKVGDRIRIPRIGQTAEILSGPDDNNQLTVRLGIMKMTVGLGEIESLDGQKVELPKTSPTPKAEKTHSPITNQPRPSKLPTVRTDKNTLDLRGKRVSEAETEIDRTLGQTIDFGALWIIHGKGTGQLRRGVHELLKQHPQVERFELASNPDGGAGVTIAYLK